LTTSRFFLFLSALVQPLVICGFRYFGEFCFPCEFAISFTLQIFISVFNASAEFDEFPVRKEASRSLSFKQSIHSDASDLTIVKIPRSARSIQLVVEIASRRVSARNFAIVIANAFVDAPVGDTNFCSDSVGFAAW